VYARAAYDSLSRKPLIMTQETLRPSTEPSPFRVITTLDGAIQENSLRAAQVAHPPARELDRRSQERVPYGRLVAITPLCDESLLPCGELIHVVGKHLSPLGLDFFHHEPIPQRFAVASLDSGPDHWLHFLLKITWCRFLKANWYDSGGHFVKIIEWPDDQFSDHLRNPLGKTNEERFYCAAEQK
jgi:hypothetical protein